MNKLSWGVSEVVCGWRAAPDHPAVCLCFLLELRDVVVFV